MIGYVDPLRSDGVFYVGAQVPASWPKDTTRPSTPYYFYNHQVMLPQPKAPVHHQIDPFVPQRDAIISALVRELKGIDTTQFIFNQQQHQLSIHCSTDMSKRLADVENDKKKTTQDLSNLKNELAQTKKLAEGWKSQSDDNRKKVKDIQTQVELLATPFRNVSIDSEDETTASARFCNCKMLTSVTNNLSTDVAELKLKLSDLTTPTALDKMPSSCADLKSLGYHNSGIFSVMGDKQVKSVYCDFTKPSSSADFEKLIGIVDTKTIRVYFHAQRKSNFSAKDTIPFDILLTSEGNAMDVSGIFTAPTSGIYFFACSGLGFLAQAKVALEAKGANEANWSSVGQTYSSAGNRQNYYIHATLRLSKGDQIRLKLIQGVLEDSDEHLTNYVGFLLDEDL
ncbi:uncharacterized protein LOC130698184 [Daphnia carinata]|uniref:uncharacterized protein LOC130698184 n=1 Tax=Daphnia carinata TaxID=120202 RepID=UPI0028684D39|nr:uncharacterized protein LOC130698184 [Daphnia carinata]